MILIVFPFSTVVNPFTCRTERKTSYASAIVTRRGEMIVIFPCTRSSKMKFFFVCSLMNLMRTGSSTSVKSIDRYVGGWATGAWDGPGSRRGARCGGTAAGGRDGLRTGAASGAGAGTGGASAAGAGAGSGAGASAAPAFGAGSVFP